MLEGGFGAAAQRSNLGLHLALQNEGFNIKVMIFTSQQPLTDRLHYYI